MQAGDCRMNPAFRHDGRWEQPMIRCVCSGAVMATALVTLGGFVVVGPAVRADRAAVLQEQGVGGDGGFAREVAAWAREA